MAPKTKQVIMKQWNTTEFIGYKVLVSFPPISLFNSVFLLSSMVILLWHKTILSWFKVFPFMASPNSWLPSSTLVSATSIPFFRNRISFSSSDAESFVSLANSSFTLTSFICSSTFLCYSRNAPYLFLAFSHDLNSSWVTLIVSMPPFSTIKSLTSWSATMVLSLVEYPWMLNKLLLMKNPPSGSIFAWNKERTEAARSQRVWKLSFTSGFWLLIPRMEAIGKRENIFHIHILAFAVSFQASKKKSTLAFLVKKSMSYFWMINVTTEL